MGDGDQERAWKDGWAATLVAFAFAMLVVLRAPILSGFDHGFGDRADGIIAIAINEHWRNVLDGVEAWNRTLYFYPYGDTLGYNDGYLLSGVIYSGWRSIADPFFADTLTAATWKGLGFAAVWWLVRRTFAWPRSVASLTAVLFTIANGHFVQADHEQLNTVALLPLAMILAVAAYRAEIAGAKGKARLIGIALAVLLGLWLLTSYYLAWFTLWFTLLLAASWFVVERPKVRDLARAHGLTMLVFAGALAIAASPFIAVYLPKAQETGAHSYQETLRFLITPIDMINVGSDNLVWGWIFRLLPGGNPNADQSWLNGEHQTGFPLIMFAIALVSLRGALRADQPQILRALALAIVVSWLMAVRLGPFSLWALVYGFVPGAKGLRVVLRYQLFLALPVLLLVLTVQRERIERWLKASPAIFGGIALLILVEQLNSADKAELPRIATLDAFASLPSPPPVCGSFYVVSARKSEPIYRSPERQALYPHNADAMLLAELWRVPTVNGFSTFNPPGWNFAHPLASDYDARVTRYARAHGLTRLCRLDARQPQPWTTLPAA